MLRNKLKNVGNTNGKDVECLNCGEQWENTFVVDDFTDEELEHVVLDYHLDDQGETGEKTRIAELAACPSCQEN